MEASRLCLNRQSTLDTRRFLYAVEFFLAYSYSNATGKRSESNGICTVLFLFNNERSMDSSPATQPVPSKPHSC